MNAVSHSTFRRVKVAKTPATNMAIPMNCRTDGSQSSSSSSGTDSSRNVYRFASLHSLVALWVIQSRQPQSQQAQRPGKGRQEAMRH